MMIKALNSQLAIIPTDNPTEGGGGEGEETEETTEDTNEETGDGQGEGEDTEDTDSDGQSGEDGEDGNEEQGNGAGDGNEEEDTEKGNGGGSDEAEGEDKGDANGDPEEGEGGDTSDSNDTEGSGDNDESYDDAGDEGEVVDYRDFSPEDFKNKGEDRQAGGNQEVDKDDPEQAKAIADMLEQLLDQMQNADEDDIDLKGHNESFGEHFGNKDNDCLENEQVWRPYFPEQDKIRTVANGDIRTAKRYQKAVRGEVASIAAKLRSKFLMARSPKTVHGVRKGNELSERRLVDSVVEIRSGRRASRPDWKREQKPDCTLSVGLVIDQSGSMGGENCLYATQGSIAIAEALDKLGAPIMVCGPRDGGYIRTDWETEQRMRDEGADRYGYGPDQKYHRTNHTVTIDVFKDWEEKMNKCLARFSKITACGGTPLSDGIQYALQELSERTERHRVIIVLTDGAANNALVVNRQIRLAKEAGIHVIGVGIGCGCSCVETQFPDNHIQIPNVSELPKRLMSILDGIMFPKKARRARLDGKLGK